MKEGLNLRLIQNTIFRQRMEEHGKSSVAVVSGGGTGIGRAIAHALAADGYEVFVLGRRRAVLDEAAQAINDALGAERAHALCADLRQPEWVAEVARQITNGAGTVDVLVNNAGGNFAAHPQNGLEGVRNDWRTNFEGNVLPAAARTRARSRRSCATSPAETPGSSRGRSSRRTAARSSDAARRSRPSRRRRPPAPGATGALRRPRRRSGRRTRRGTPSRRTF